MFVLIRPGIIIEIKTLLLTFSALTLSKKPCKACFVAEYEERYGNPNFPTILLVTPICPPPFLIMVGNTLFVSSIVPKKFTSKILRSIAIFVSFA